MKQVYFLLLVIIFKMQIISAEQNEWHEVRMNNHSIYVDSTIRIVARDTLEKHLRIVKAIIDSCKSIEYQKIKKSTFNSNDSITISKKDLGCIEYCNNSKDKNFFSATIDRSGFIRKLYFLQSTRGLTKDELKYYFKTHKIPDSYKNVSEQEAIKIARMFHRAVYGKKEDSKFDSVSIMVTNISYTISFTIMTKNDIWDPRTSSISVNANTGSIESFSCEGLSNIDFNYTPKVGRQQVLQMYNEAVDSLRATIKIRTITLNKYPNKKCEKRWAWCIYGQREDKHLLLSAMFFVDSETGEVLLNGLD